MTFFLWTSSHSRSSVRRPARTYILLLCTNTGCSLEDMPEAMNCWDGWGREEKESVNEIHVCSMIWWWWFHILISQSNIFGASIFKIFFNTLLKKNEKKRYSISWTKNFSAPSRVFETSWFIYIFEKKYQSIHSDFLFCFTILIYYSTETPTPTLIGGL